MLIKCFKKSSFRDSHFPSLSPRAPQWVLNPILGRCFISCGTLLQQISKSFAERPAWGSCRLGPVPGTLIPATQNFFPCLLRTRLPQEPGWERSHVCGVWSPLLLLCLCLFFHRKHQQLPVWSAKGSIHRILFSKSSTQRNLQGCGFPAAEHVCFEQPALLGVQAGVSLLQPPQHGQGWRRSAQQSLVYPGNLGGCCGPQMPVNFSGQLTDSWIEQAVGCQAELGEKVQ